MNNREGQVLALIMEGKSPKQIAKELHLSTYTVRGYVASLKSQYGVSTTAELIVARMKQLCFCSPR